MPAMTPMTMPAMAPPLRPLLDVEAIPAVALVEVGVLKGTVVVGEPVEVTVWTVLLVGRMNAEAVLVTEEK